MPPRRFPLHDGPLRLPPNVTLGPIAVTFRGAASIVITDTDTGNIVYQGATLDANPPDVSTVQVDLSRWNDNPTNLAVAVTGNVQGTITTS